MAKISIKHHIAWYNSQRLKYQSLAEIVAATLRALLKNNNINYIDIPFRAKTIESFQEKIVRKKYKSPEAEMMDLAGVRIITYIESDVGRVSKLIESTFNVHPSSSVDKTADLGEDRFGYRSVHFVCDVGPVREILPEFIPYKGLLFEVQVRTALQHTWAEIEHDRSYKFSGELPQRIKRRFHLVAGLLELADREFDELTSEIDKYSSEVHKQADSGNLDIELNSTSILEFLKIKLAGTPMQQRVEPSGITQDVIEELNIFGVKSLSELNSLITDEFIEKESKHQIWSSSIGLLRDAMMYSDVHIYFSKCWRGAWSGLDLNSFDMLSEKFGGEALGQIVGENELDVFDDSWDRFNQEEFND